MNKDLVKFLRESAELNYDVDDMEDDEIDYELDAEYDDVDDMDDDDEFYYEEEMIPVIARGEKFLVEQDNVLKLMEHNKYDVATAMEKISECNELDPSKLYMVIESQSTIKEIISEKCVGSSKAKKKKEKVGMVDFLKDAKKKGIKMLKKKK